MYFLTLRFTIFNNQVSSISAMSMTRTISQKN